MPKSSFNFLWTRWYELWASANITRVRLRSPCLRIWRTVWGVSIAEHRCQKPLKQTKPAFIEHRLCFLYYCFVIALQTLFKMRHSPQTSARHTRARWFTCEQLFSIFLSSTFILFQSPSNENQNNEKWAYSRAKTNKF